MAKWLKNSISRTWVMAILPILLSVATKLMKKNVYADDCVTNYTSQFTLLWGSVNFPAIWKLSKLIAILKKCSPLLTDFRPISLIHSVAKLISKVPAMRPTKQLDGLISVAQSAFIRKKVHPRQLPVCQKCGQEPKCQQKADILFQARHCQGF